MSFFDDPFGWDFNNDGKVDDDEFCEGFATTMFIKEQIEKEDRDRHDNSYRRSSKSDGCYVATCVYGSYDCPEVWTLRRYRDYSLRKSRWGRAFIKTYYAISPTIVKIFGKTKVFRDFWRKRLDRMVGDLQSKGFESTPYRDNVSG